MNMALRTTNITTSLIRNAIGAAVNSIGTLCTHININKWSKYKPVRSNFPSADGKYGLNILLSTLSGNWDYLRPRGISNNEPFSAGHFRGYEPDTTLAFPTMHLLDSEKDVKEINPKGYDRENTWIIRIYRSASDVLILPSDLGYDSYYVGIRVSGDDVDTNYKTLFQVSDGQASGTEVDVSVIYDEITDSFSNLPLGWGTYNYQFFISSSASNYSEGKYQWQTTPLSNIIFLPHEGIYISNGSFDVSPSWTLFAEDKEFNVAATPAAPGYVETTIHTKVDPFEIESAPEWLDVEVYYDGNWISNPSLYATGFQIRITPEINENYTPRSGYITLINSLGGYDNVTINQAKKPQPPQVSVQKADGQTFTYEEESGSISEYSDQLSFTFRNLDGWSSTPLDMDYYILDADNNTVKTGVLEDMVNHPTHIINATVTISRTAQDGDVFRVFLGTAV